MKTDFNEINFVKDGKISDFDPSMFFDPETLTLRPDIKENIEYRMKKSYEKSEEEHFEKLMRRNKNEDANLYDSIIPEEC